MMMLRPSIFTNSFVDDMFNDMFSFPAKTFKKNTPVMKTDVKEVDGNYELEIDLPGYRKEDLQAELKDGYLTVSANTNKEENEKDEEGRYVRRERYTGVCKRSFYVGEALEQEDIKASFENGVLKLVFPKDKQVEPEVEENRYIQIL